MEMEMGVFVYEKKMGETGSCFHGAPLPEN